VHPGIRAWLAVRSCTNRSPPVFLAHLLENLSVGLIRQCAQKPVVGIEDLFGGIIQMLMIYQVRRKNFQRGLLKKTLEVFHSLLDTGVP